MKVAAATGDIASSSYDNVAVITVIGLPSLPIQLIMGGDGMKRL